MNALERKLKLSVVIEPDFVLVRDDNIVQVELEDRTVLFSMRAGLCFELNPVASKIWRLLAVRCPVSRVIESLARDYAAETDVVQRDVRGFLQELAENGLVRVLRAEPQ